MEKDYAITTNLIPKHGEVISEIHYNGIYPIITFVFDYHLSIKCVYARNMLVFLVVNGYNVLVSPTEMKLAKCERVETFFIVKQSWKTVIKKYLKCKRMVGFIGLLYRLKIRK